MSFTNIFYFAVVSLYARYTCVTCGICTCNSDTGGFHKRKDSTGKERPSAKLAD